MSETLKIQNEIYKRICFIHKVRGSHETVSELLRQFHIIAIQKYVERNYSENERDFVIAFLIGRLMHLFSNTDTAISSIEQIKMGIVMHQIGAFETLFRMLLRKVEEASE